MYYTDGSVYEGEWYNDQRNGKGVLKLANGNRYEGMWEGDQKNGPGKFLYMDKGQVYTGNWKDGIAKCGILEDFNREEAPNPPRYPLPPVSPPPLYIGQVFSDQDTLFLRFSDQDTLLSHHVLCPNVCSVP